MLRRRSMDRHVFQLRDVCMQGSVGGEHFGRERFVFLVGFVVFDETCDEADDLLSQAGEAQDTERISHGVWEWGVLFGIE